LAHLGFLFFQSGNAGLNECETIQQSNSGIRSLILYRFRVTGCRVQE